MMTMWSKTGTPDAEIAVGDGVVAVGGAVAVRDGEGVWDGRGSALVGVAVGRWVGSLCGGRGCGPSEQAVKSVKQRVTVNNNVRLIMANRFFLGSICGLQV